MKNNKTYSVFGFITIGIYLISAMVIAIGAIVSIFSYPNITRTYAIISIVLNIIFAMAITLFSALAIKSYRAGHGFSNYLILGIISLFIYDFLLRTTFGSFGTLSHNFWEDELFLVSYIFMFAVLILYFLGYVFFQGRKPTMIKIGKIIMSIVGVAWLIFFSVFFKTTWNVVLDSSILMVGFAIVGLVTITTIPTLFIEFKPNTIKDLQE